MNKIYAGTANALLRDVVEDWGRRTSVPYQTMKKLPPLPLSPSLSSPSHFSSPLSPCASAMIPYA